MVPLIRAYRGGMRGNPGLNLLGTLLRSLLRAPRHPTGPTDVDFRRLPEHRDVIAGWESRPHVPGATHDDVR